jgi:hypothetical protein
MTRFDIDEVLQLVRPESDSNNGGNEYELDQEKQTGRNSIRRPNRP